jgi:hypothetical protein
MNWVPVNTPMDIAALMDAYSGFHDSCIISANYISGAYVDDRFAMHGKNRDCTLVLRLDSQMAANAVHPWKKTIEMKFIGLRRMYLTGYEDNYFCEILSCYLTFHQNWILWSDQDDFDPDRSNPSSLFEEPMTTFVLADRLEWRFTEEVP